MNDDKASDPLPENFPYRDIFYLKRPKSRRATHLSAESRAAQFMPFDALTGFDESIAETERITASRSSLDGYAVAELNERFNYLKLHNFPKAKITVTVFVRDPKKEGGSYVNVEGIIRNIDEIERKVRLDDGRVFSLDDIEAIDGELFLEGEI